jgi:hypothetical protein
MISKSAVKNLRELYFGELVIVYLKGMNLVVPNEEMGQVEISAMVQGIIMDIDEAFVHIGDGEFINKSIKHDDYGVIELVMANEAMMSSDMAIGDEDVH